MAAEAVEDEYFWFWYEDGQWIVFDESALVQIEDARKRGLDSVRIANTPYLLNLMFLQQINENTGYPRDIAKAEACWYWLDDDGETWRRYSREDSLKLALASLSPVGDHWTYLEHGQTLYYVDIKRLVQRNTASDYERNIHQGVPPELKNPTVRNNSRSLPEAAGAGVGPPVAAAAASACANSSPADIFDEDDDDEHIIEEEREEEEGLYENPIPHYFFCPLSKRTMIDPVQTVVGSTYERKYIERYLKRNNRDPLTDAALKSKSLLENRVLRDSIEAWKEKFATTKVKAKGGGNQKAEPGGGGLSKSTKAVPSKPSLSFTNDYVPSDTHQDTLKVICVGLSNFGSDVALRNPTTAEGKLGVQRYSWRIKTTTTTTAADNNNNNNNNNNHGIHCNVYDFVGQKVHHATQELFFTEQAVYVVVWDMGKDTTTTLSDSDLERDVYEKVHFWVDAIARHSPGAVILPVVSLDGYFNNTRGNSADIQMEEMEVQRRCAFLKSYYDNMQQEMAVNGLKVNLFFENDTDPVIRIGGAASNSDRLNAIKGWLLQHRNDPSMFPNLGQPIPSTNQLLRDVVAQMAGGGTHVVEANQISDMLGIGEEEEIHQALQYLSDAGEILFYGSISDDLKKFAVLNPSWLVTAVASILLPAINDAIRSVRRNDFVGETDESQLYHGPVATEENIRALWQAQFLASNGTLKAGINADLEQLLDFLQRLFTRIGVMVSLNASQREWSDDHTSLDSNLLFLPGLLSQRDQAQFVGIYNNSVFSKTTLAQSVQFRTVVSPILMEQICASVLGRIYAVAKRGGDIAAGAVVADDDLQVKEIVCWRTLLHVKINLKTLTSNGDSQWSVVDLYAHLVESLSPLCVGATYMGEAKQSLIVSGKGEEGNDGQVIWKGGFGLITEAIRGVLESSSHGMEFERNYFCPSCLAKQNLRDARSWSEIMLQTALGRGEEDLICEDGHTTKTQLILRDQQSTPDDDPIMSDASQIHSMPVPPADVHARELMPGVVMVGLYDEKRKTGKIRKVGSGFVIDSERGLIVTAAHTLMLLWGQENFGRDYDGIEGAKAVIGVIPDNYDASRDDTPALFRYFATIYKKDPSLELGECHIDACILQITSRFENDVGGNGDLCSDEISIRLTGKPALMKRQGLATLAVTEEVHVGEPVRILGFDQADSTRLNRTFGISGGRVYKQFETKSVGGERFRYTPRKKIVLNCPTIGGHSGGPCVNQNGEVIGILSCADFTEKSRCYLVPTSEWLNLIDPPSEQKNEVVHHRPCRIAPTKVDVGTLKPAPGSLMVAKRPAKSPAL